MSPKMCHIPKRSTQHGIFMPSFEIPPTQLKPGQVSLERQLYSEEVKDHVETYVETDLAMPSVYQQSIAKHVRPKDYYYPRQPIRQSEPPEGGGHHACAHWKSTYRSDVNDAARFDTVLYRQNGPSYQIANPPTCVSGETCESTCVGAYGARNSDPRARFGPNLDGNPTLKTALTIGTTKGTNHMPGYSGFLPSNTSNPRVAEVCHGGTLRSNDKTNLTAIFHTNMVNYAGHKPLNACNDRGGVSNHTLSQCGDAYRPPPPQSYA